MIFAKTHVVDPDAGLIHTDVTIKVCCGDLMAHELQAVITSVISSDFTDLKVSEQIAQIMNEEADKLAAHVRDLMEGENGDQST